MCGIVGIIGPRATEALAKDMTRKIAHRGPDGEGVFVAPGVALGHRRLSVIDLSDAGLQPMTSSDGRLTIVFNGEIYNYKELRAELPVPLGGWRSATDTEVVLQAYAVWGPACVERFIGMFAFLIYDLNDHSLFGARDRLGIKPLYSARNGGTYAFASEIKALLPFLPSVQPNEETIAAYLDEGLYDHRETTFFAGVARVPAGTRFSIRNGIYHSERYWDLWRKRDMWVDVVRSRGTAEEAFRTILTDSIRLRLRSDVPVGINVSSGLDSSVVLYATNAASASRRLLHVFTMRLADEQYDESRYVAPIVEETRNPWHVSTLDSEDVFPLAEEVLRSQDEPYGGVPTIAYYKLNRLARDAGVTVLLEGQGGDELFGGYAYYRGMHYADLLASGNIRALLAESTAIGDGGLLRLPRGFKRLLIESTRTGVRHQDGSRFQQRSCLNGAWLGVHRPAPQVPMVAERSRFVRRSATDTLAAKLPRVLRFNDHASMAYGLELRLPLLDHRIVELAFALPSAWKIEHGVMKSFLREAVRGLVPDYVRLLPKRKDLSPQGVWFSGPLRPEVEAIFTSKSFQLRPFVRSNEVRETFRRYAAAPRKTNSFFFWQLLNLELWYRMFID